MTISEAIRSADEHLMPFIERAGVKVLLWGGTWRFAIEGELARWSPSEEDLRADDWQAVPR